MKVYLVLRVVEDRGDLVRAVCKTMANAEIRREQLKQWFYNVTNTTWEIQEVELEE